MSSRIVLFFLLIFGACFQNSCYYDNEEELYGAPVECGLENLSFDGDIEPILDRYCYECHDNANQLGGITLEGYQNVLPYIENEELLGSIRHEVGYSPMPDNAPKLETCRIEAIEIWVMEGARNN